MTESRRESANLVIEDQLDLLLLEIEKEFNAEAIVFNSPILYGIDDFIRRGIERLPHKRQKLIVLIETPGGYIEVAERIANTFREHYLRVEFIIPDSAMSAGTVLVLSGDAIYMDYYSVLGPIDPQIENSEGRLVPALGYLIQFERLIEKSKKGTLTTAEMAFLIQRFDPASLYSYEQARELSIKLLKEWLVKYKFKNWKKTQKRGVKVTAQMRKDRAEEIAKKLNKTEHWSSHARGISMDVLRKELNLVIEDFSKINGLNKKIKCYYNLLEDYMSRRGHQAVVHTRNHYTRIFGG